MPYQAPTLYEWLGGPDALSALIARFYQKVPADPLLEPLFRDMDPAHFEHVAEFIAEVLGGPAEYSAHHGGHAAMIRHHLGKGITEQQRQHWVRLLLETADELNLPSDPEFRSALVAYLEWGSRLAVTNSALSSDTLIDAAPMPTWGWGVPGGPYRPDSETPDPNRG
ncbi:MAG: group II truncated hemoglobin [Acidobacteriaceae bacterium]